MGTLILTGKDVDALLTLGDCITAVEEAFRRLAMGQALGPEVLAVHGAEGAFHVKAAGLTTPWPYFAAKVNGNFPGNRERHGLPTIQGVIVLADLERGTPLAVMDSARITELRTGAATAVAAKYLARDVESVVTIAGCGLQGRVQLRSIAAVRRISRVNAVDSDGAAAERFAAEMGAELGRPVRAAPGLRAALRESDIVVTCTTATRPIVFGGDLAPGAFLAAVGADNPHKQEIDPALMAAATVVVDVLGQAATIGDLHHALEAGAMRRDEVAAELGEVVAGQKPGRTREDEIIVFDSTGMALQDVVSAALVYERAVAAGRGMSVELAAGA